MALDAHGDDCILMLARTVVGDHNRCRWGCERSLAEFASPELKDLAWIGQSPAAIASTTNGHHALAYECICQRLAVCRPESLKTEPSRVGSARPFLERYFRRFKAFALDDRHLPPRAIEPYVPGLSMPAGR